MTREKADDPKHRTSSIKHGGDNVMGMYACQWSLATMFIDDVATDGSSGMNSECTGLYSLPSQSPHLNPAEYAFQLFNTNLKAERHAATTGKVRPCRVSQGWRKKSYVWGLWVNDFRQSLTANTILEFMLVSPNVEPLKIREYVQYGNGFNSKTIYWLNSLIKAWSLLFTHIRAKWY